MAAGRPTGSSDAPRRQAAGSGDSRSGTLTSRGRSPKSGGRGRKKPDDQSPGLSPEERAHALDIAKRSGIPFSRAVTVLRGQETLDHVLKDLFIKQRRDKFVRDGLEPSLAGQVANDRLPLDRAQRIQSVWKAQNASFHSDRLGALQGTMVAIGLFEHGIVVGRLTRVGRYDIALHRRDSDIVETFKKHQIKFYSKAESLDSLTEVVQGAPDAASASPGFSTVLAERWRPDEELALKWAREQPMVSFRFRDGQTIQGRPVRVAIYEIELGCGETTIGVLTHALVKERPFDVA
jgi:hypothetical protein